MNAITISVSIFILFMISYFFYYERQLQIYEKSSSKRNGGLLTFMASTGVMISFGYYIIGVLLITPQRTFREDIPYLIAFVIIHFAWVIITLICIYNFSKRLSCIKTFYGLKECSIVKALVFFNLGVIPGIIYFQTHLTQVTEMEESQNFR